MVRVKIYGDSRSGCTRRVAVVCKELGLEYELVLVNLTEGDHKQPEFVDTMQPFGAVPVLENNKSSPPSRLREDENETTAYVMLHSHEQILFITQTMTVFRYVCITSKAPHLARARHSVSGSPYGRSHLIPKTPKLPNPVVATYPQTVYLSDGSSFTHRTTAPRSVVRLTRDITNNPVWQPGQEARAGEEEDLSGRIGRFKRRFEEESSFGEGEFEGLMDSAKGQESLDKMKDGKTKNK